MRLTVSSVPRYPSAPLLHVPTRATTVGRGGPGAAVDTLHHHPLPSHILAAAAGDRDPFF
ncbi:hypothetical protein Taro_038842 [Colocasia esculenta]|uniref:Uncharacterized protein n=1 Tax=Colocasia esculenta TaxID=4460 RepID=A0A843WH10_COLES|nr:hypothetical protein [Colocasia esculenta]